MRGRFRLAIYAAVAAGAVLAQGAWNGALAQKGPIKIGHITTVSGPQGVVGRDMIDGFRLAMRHSGDTVAGRRVEVVWGDDMAKPDIGRQVADRMIESDRVHIMTGIIFSNVLLASVKPILDAGVFYLSSNAGPSQIAGRQCHPHFFGVAFQGDNNFEGLGQHMRDKGFKRVYFLAPNYPAGRDMATGFKRYYKEKLLAEVYTAFGQLDYSAEIAQIRAAKPDAVVIFYPGGMGINFVKQYVQAGLMKQIPLLTGAGTVDQTTLPAIGEDAIGMYTGVLWSEFLDNPANKRFVADFEKEHNRIPSSFAAASYDTGMLIMAALNKIGGQIEDKAAFRKAVASVPFQSTRGNFRFGPNQFPIHDYFLVNIERDAKGRIVAGLRGTIMKDLTDAYADTCKMPPL